MAWAFVKQNATLGAGVTSQATAFGSNVAAGSLIIVAVHCNGTGTTVSGTKPADTRGTNYTACAAPVTLAGLGMAQLWYGITPSAGADTVTVTPSVSDTVYVGVAEYSGIQPVPFDVPAGTSGTSTTPASGNTAATATDNELAFGFCFAGGTATAGGGWSSRSTFNGDCFEDKNITPSGVANAAFTMAPSAAWIALVATFKQADGGNVRTFNPIPFQAQGRNL